MEVKDMFFCYSINLYDFLKNQKGFTYLLTANHIHTSKQFWVFNKNDELLKALDEYRENGKELNK